MRTSGQSSRTRSTPARSTKRLGKRQLGLWRDLAGRLEGEDWKNDARFKAGVLVGGLLAGHQFYFATLGGTSVNEDGGVLEIDQVERLSVVGDHGGTEKALAASYSAALYGLNWSAEWGPTTSSRGGSLLWLRRRLATWGGAGQRLAARFGTSWCGSAFRSFLAHWGCADDCHDALRVALRCLGGTRAQAGYGPGSHCGCRCRRGWARHPASTAPREDRVGSCPPPTSSGLPGARRVGSGAESGRCSSDEISAAFEDAGVEPEAGGGSRSGPTGGYTAAAGEGCKLLSRTSMLRR